MASAFAVSDRVALLDERRIDLVVDASRSRAVAAAAAGEVRAGERWRSASEQRRSPSRRPAARRRAQGRRVRVPHPDRRRWRWSWCWPKAPRLRAARVIHTVVPGGGRPARGRAGVALGREHRHWSRGSRSAEERTRLALITSTWRSPARRSARIGTDSVARIGTQGLLGDKIIELSVSDQARAICSRRAPPSTAEPPTDINRLIDKASAVLDRATHVADGAVAVIDSISDPKSLAALRGIVASMEHLAAAARRAPGWYTRCSSIRPRPRRSATCSCRSTRSLLTSTGRWYTSISSSAPPTRMARSW